MTGARSHEWLVLAEDLLKAGKLTPTLRQRFREAVQEGNAGTDVVGTLRVKILELHNEIDAIHLEYEDEMSRWPE